MDLLDQLIKDAEDMKLDCVDELKDIKIRCLEEKIRIMERKIDEESQIEDGMQKISETITDDQYFYAGNLLESIRIPDGAKIVIERNNGCVSVYAS